MPRLFQKVEMQFLDTFLHENVHGLQTKAVIYKYKLSQKAWSMLNIYKIDILNKSYSDLYKGIYT